jgi:hypothetical protein
VSPLPSQRRARRLRRGALVAVAAGAIAAATPIGAVADVAPGQLPVSATPVPAASAATSTVTLLTGQKVTVVAGDSGHTTYAVQPSGAADDGFVSWQLGPAGDHYVIPVDALPYLGKGLDRSLFDVTTLSHRGLVGNARIPVDLAFTAGTVPTSLPGVTLTSVRGASAQGYLTPASSAAFVKALRSRIGADVAAGRSPGSTPLSGGLTGMTVAGTAATAVVTPKYPLHTLQITATDATGVPADADSIVVNNDSVAREAADVPVAAGLGRVAVPAGDYSVITVFPRWDDEGNLIELRQVSPMDVTVSTSGGMTNVDVDARTATSVVRLGTTPKPSVTEVRTVNNLRIDAVGSAARIGMGVWNDSTLLAVAPQPAPSIGQLRLQAQFDATATVPSDNYRYDLVYSADHLDADQSYGVDPAGLAAVHHHFSNDPAADPQGSLLAGPFDPESPVVEEIGGYTAPSMPGDLTEYVHTYPGSSWSETAFSGGIAHGEPRSFAGGKQYDVNWFHGPLAPALGEHHTDSYGECLMCTAGPVATLAYNTLGDSTPDHLGTAFQNTNLTAYVNGQAAVSGDGYIGAVLTGVPTGAATYRLLLTTDSAGDPGTSQSTHTVTDLTVKSPAVTDPASALPPSQTCEGQGAGTPCQILPALNLTYNLSSDLTNTSYSPVQAMSLAVSHISYDGKGSTAPITSAKVRVSFDRGASWQSASVAGAQGYYQVLWTNPASAASSAPMLQVTATDAVGGSITQTITNAYSIAAAHSAKR